MRILLIEDDSALAQAVVNLLQKDGYETDVADSAFAGVEAAISGAFDCLIVDVRLPDGTGFDVVADLRDTGIPTPILMLTVQNDPADRVRGLNAGADDYLGKPFDPAELLARVRALIRRSNGVREIDALVHGRATLYRNSRTLQVGQNLVELSSKEFLLLESLFQNPGQVMTREQLVARVWGPEAEVADSALDTYIYFLRKKAANMGWRTMIRTVRGKGYQLGAPL